jgi:hypothetical protein
MNEVLYVTEVKAYSPAELADIYKVSKCTLNRWLKPHQEKIGKREGLYYTVRQIRIIFEVLGLPGRIEE